MNASAAELLALTGVVLKTTDSAAGVTLHQELRAAWRFESVPGIFMNPLETAPFAPGEQAAVNFSAEIPWREVHQQHKERYNGAKLLLLLRHAQAWMNLPEATVHGVQQCSFVWGHRSVANWDSSLTDPLGSDQAANLAAQLGQPAPEDQGNSTWAEALGVERAAVFVSPNDRALATAELALGGLVQNPIVVSELLRASLGEVCNARRPVFGYQSTLPAPWTTGCLGTVKGPNDTIAGRYGATGHFSFPVRPPGASRPGLVSDADSVWRQDLREVASDHEARATAFLAQVFETVEEDVAVVVTHGEIIQAILAVSGDPAAHKTHIAGTQLVPVLLRQLPPWVVTPEPKAAEVLMVPWWGVLATAIVAAVLAFAVGHFACRARAPRRTQAALVHSALATDSDEPTGEHTY